MVSFAMFFSKFSTCTLIITHFLLQTLYEYLMYFFPFILFYVPVEHPRFSRVSPVFRKKGRTTTITVILGL